MAANGSQRQCRMTRRPWALGSGADHLNYTDFALLAPRLLRRAARGSAIGPRPAAAVLREVLLGFGRIVVSEKKRHRFS
jgi:hypothetical protein